MMNRPSIHNVVSDVLEELGLDRILDDRIRTNENNDNFTTVSLLFKHDRHRHLVVEFFVDDDGDYSAMVLQNNDFPRRLERVFMEEMMDALSDDED
jgi:hypothetical protein